MCFWHFLFTLWQSSSGSGQLRRVPETWGAGSTAGGRDWVQCRLQGPCGAGEWWTIRGGEVHRRGAWRKRGARSQQVRHLLTYNSLPHGCLRIVLEWWTNMFNLFHMTGISIDFSIMDFFTMVKTNVMSAFWSSPTNKWKSCHPGSCSTFRRCGMQTCQLVRISRRSSLKYIDMLCYIKVHKSGRFA